MNTIKITQCGISREQEGLSIDYQVPMFAHATGSTVGRSEFQVFLYVYIFQVTSVHRYVFIHVTLFRVYPVGRLVYLFACCS